MKNLCVICLFCLAIISCNNSNKEIADNRISTNAKAEKNIEEKEEEIEEEEIVKKNKVFVGDIGGERITIKLQFENSYARGYYYFHKNIDKKVAIRGSTDQGGFDFRKVEDDNPDFFNFVGFSPSGGEDEYEGSWQKNNDSEKLQFKIEQVAAANLPILNKVEQLQLHFFSYFDDPEGEMAAVFSPEMVDFLFEDGLDFWVDKNNNWFGRNYVKPIGIVKEKEYILFVLNAVLIDNPPSQGGYKVAQGTLFFTVSYSGELLSYYKYQGYFADGKKNTKEIESTPLTRNMTFSTSSNNGITDNFSISPDGFIEFDASGM